MQRFAFFFLWSLDVLFPKPPIEPHYYVEPPAMAKPKPCNNIDHLNRCLALQSKVSYPRSIKDGH